MPWIVYVVRCRDGTFYTGVTTDPQRRLAQHNAGAGGAYTRARKPVVLVYSEEVRGRPDALRRELEIKRLSRAAKELLVSGGARRGGPAEIGPGRQVGE